MKQILLLGAYGQNNLGDELLIKSFLNNLKGYKIIANSTNPKETSEKFGIEVFDTNKDKLKLFRLIINSSYIFFGGGSQFKTLPSVFKRRKESLLINILLITFISRILFKKTYFISIGAGPIDTRLGRILTRLIILFSTKILLRDTSSFNLMYSIQNSKKLISSVDGLYFEKNNIEKINNVKEKDDDKMKSKTVLISPNLNLKDTNLINLEIDVLAEVTNKLSSEGFKVYFVPFQIGFAVVDDLKASQLIIERSNVKFDYDPIIIIKKDNEIFSVISQATLMIGVRLHSVIISTLCNTPAIALSYDPKVRGYMKDLNLEELVLDINKDLNYKKINEIVSKILYNYITIKNEILVGVNKNSRLLTNSLDGIEIFK